MKKLVIFSLFLCSCRSDSSKIVESIDKLVQVQEKANAIARERNELIKDGLRLQEAIHKDKLDTCEIYTRSYTN